MIDGEAEAAGGPGAERFCREGCYWECEHLAATGAVSAERAALRPVDDRDGMTLMRCQDCGDYLTDVVAHAREHERMRQLGWLPAGSSSAPSAPSAPTAG